MKKVIDKVTIINEIAAIRIKRTYRLKVMAHILDYLNYKITGRHDSVSVCDKPLEKPVKGKKPVWRTFYMFVDSPEKAFQWTERYIRGTDPIETNDFELCCELSDFDYNTVINNIIDDDHPYLNEHREMMYSQLKHLFKCLSESRHSTGGISEYKIKENDTVSIVAQKFQMTTEQVEDLNTDVEMVPGSVIKVMNKTSTHV